MKLRYSLILLLAIPLSLAAQKKKKAAAPAYITDYSEVRAIIDSYHFEQAIEILEDDIAKRTKKKKPADEAEALLELAHRRQAKLMATERVMVIDSLIVDKKDILRHIPLSSESGTMQLVSETTQKPDSAQCVIFRNQLNNFLILAQPARNRRLQLFQSELIGTEWSKPAALKGIKDEEIPADHNYPFMLTDGTTLYFASRDEEGLGGYDIYMTRYDADERTYLAPENIGMPFNSPANDYLLAIDEFYNLGWFVSDRNMDEGKVCVYTFIPNTTRKIYNEDETGTDKLCRLAQLSNISETWFDKPQVDEARQRLKALTQANGAGKGQRDFTFVLNNKRVCHSQADFQKAEVRPLLKKWQEESKRLSDTRQQLAQLRSKYARANATEKAQMAAQVRLTETNFEQLLNAVDLLEKQIRQIELGK